MITHEEKDYGAVGWAWVCFSEPFPGTFPYNKTVIKTNISHLLVMSYKDLSRLPVPVCCAGASVAGFTTNSPTPWWESPPRADTSTNTEHHFVWWCILRQWQTFSHPSGNRFTLTMAVTVQPGSYQRSDFQTGLCDCCDDVGTCKLASCLSFFKNIKSQLCIFIVARSQLSSGCLGLWCYPCLGCTIASAMDECCLCGLGLPIRAVYRTKYNISVRFWSVFLLFSALIWTLFVYIFHNCSKHHEKFKAFKETFKAWPVCKRCVTCWRVCLVSGLPV